MANPTVRFLALFLSVSVCIGELFLFPVGVWHAITSKQSARIRSGLACTLGGIGNRTEVSLPLGSNLIQTLSYFITFHSLPSQCQRCQPGGNERLYLAGCWNIYPTIRQIREHLLPTRASRMDDAVIQAAVDKTHHSVVVVHRLL